MNLNMCNNDDQQHDEFDLVKFIPEGEQGKFFLRDDEFEFVLSYEKAYSKIEKFKNNLKYQLEAAKLELHARKVANWINDKKKCEEIVQIVVEEVHQDQEARKKTHAQETNEKETKLTMTLRPRKPSHFDWL